MQEVAEILTERELADLLRVRLSVLRLLRRRGLPPRYVMVGKHVRYSRSAIARFLAGLETDQENDQNSAAVREE
jgi:hypothetical protein